MLAACFPNWSTVGDRREEYFFDVTLTSDTAGYTRVLWDAGQGFSEHDSSIQPVKVEAKPVTYRYLLPYGRIRGFRLVPVDRAAKVTLSELRVVGPADRLLHRFAMTDLAAGPGIGSLMTETGVAKVAIAAANPEPYLTIRLAAPLDLPLTLHALWHPVAPLVIAMLGVGLLLASRVGDSFVRRVSPLARTSERHPLWALALTSALAVLWQAHPVVFQGRSFVSPANGGLMLYGDLPTVPGSTQRVYADGMASDTGAMLFQHLYYPMLERDALVRDHELPLWNRSSLAGVPLLGQGQSMLGDPLNVLTILADGASWAWDVRFMLARWMLAFGLAVVAWQVTRHLSAALLVALGGSFLGFFTYRLNHPANFSLGYAPWLLVAWVALAQATSRRQEIAALALLLLAHGAEFCSGTVKEAVVLIAVLDVAGVLCVWPMERTQRRRRLWLAAAVGALFLLLAAPFWWSFLDALRHSYTAYDAPHADQLPLGELIGLFDDIFYRQNSAEESVIAPALNFLFLGGVLAWVVRPSSRRRWGWPLAVASGGCVAIGFGLVPARWIEAVPFLGNVISIGGTFSCALLVLLAPLAAIGFAGAGTTFGDRSGRLRLVIATALLTLLGVVWYVNPARVTFSPFARGYAAMLVVALVALGVAWRWTVSRRAERAWWAACLLAMPLLLWRHGQSTGSAYNHYVFVPGERVHVHARSAAASVVTARLHDPSRVIGFGTNLFPGYPAAMRWESLYGVDALRNRWYQELATALDLERVWRWDAPDAEAAESSLRAGRDALNVRYYLADHQEVAKSLSGLTRIATADLDVYESAQAWPRAFFVDTIVPYDTPAAFAQLVRNGDGRPFAAVQNGEATVLGLKTDLTKRTIREATGYRVTSRTTRFEIEAPSTGVAVLCEAYYPGDFRVTIDGKPATYFRVNHAFKGVAITTPGRHEIRFAYWPKHFTAALTLCALGVLLLLVALGWSARA
jgi:hypothetical protein